MANKTYSEKLKHPNWQRKKSEIQIRDNFTCQYCGDKENNLQVHHKIYEFGKEPWDYPDDNFILLCEKCHKDEGFYKKCFTETVNGLLTSGYKYRDLWNLLSALENHLDIGKADRIMLSSFCISDIDLLKMAQRIIMSGQNRFFIESQENIKPEKKKKTKVIEKIISKKVDTVDDEPKMNIEIKKPILSLYDIRKMIANGEKFKSYW